MVFSKTSNMLVDAAAKRAPRFTSPASFCSIVQFRKFYSLVVLANVFVMFCGLQGTEAFTDVSPYIATLNGRTCVENFDPDVDYFENSKITAVYENEDMFIVDYHKFFKIVQVKVNNDDYKAYVLWLCGTREPTPEEITTAGLSGDSESIQIPPTSFGISNQNDAAFFQQLGALDTLKFAATAADLPQCIDGKYYEAKGGCFTSNCVYGEWNAMGSCAPEVFFSAYSTIDQSFPANSHVVEVPFYAILTSVADRSDKILYYSTFLNRESIAMQTVDGISASVQCIKDAYTPAATKKNVLMLTYYSAGEFYLPSCPNYYCDIIVDGFGENLITRVDLGATAGKLPKENITAKLVELDLDVDVIMLNQPADEVDLIPGPDANGATELTVLIDMISSNQGFEPRVFDSVGNSPFFFSYEALPELIMNDWLFMLDESTATNAITAAGADSTNGMFFYEHYPKGNNASAVGLRIFEELCSCQDHALTLSTLVAGTCKSTALETARSNFNDACDADAGSNFVAECGFLSSPANEVKVSIFASLMLVLVAAFGMN